MEAAFGSHPESTEAGRREAQRNTAQHNVTYSTGDSSRAGNENIKNGIPFLPDGSKRHYLRGHVYVCVCVCFPLHILVWVCVCVPAYIHESPSILRDTHWML